ncbi:MAG: cell wall hydrolase [Beijerinckiaceae bacterium]|nr:cell wall hydrolase [Beijerinckiaceae bacterium]MCI0736382.1 cell wall hydrolase [Beijerinckiaceae bacterium]
MDCSHTGWAFGVIAPWCLGIAFAVSISADAGEVISSGISISSLPLRMQAPPADLVPANPSVPGPDFGSFAGEAQNILHEASLAIGASEEFKRLPDEVEPRADLKRDIREFPEIDRSRRGDPLAGLRPAFDTRLRHFHWLSRFRAGELIFHYDETEPASGFAVSNEAIGPESVAAFEPWPDGESPTTAHGAAGASPAQLGTSVTMRPAALNEWIMQGATPLVRRAITLGSATPAASSSTPIEVAAFPASKEWPFAAGGEYAGVRQNFAALIDQDKAEREKRCLAEAVYFEARGEPEEGQAAVAQVVLNRVSSGLYPATICGVVYQNRRHFQACQFSFACDGMPIRITEPDAWRQAKQVASEVTNGTTYVSEIGSSTHFHANYVRPRWARRLEKMEVIGHHIFYKLRPGQS